MKTTLELPDDLLIEAKTVAAKRRITLKELFTKALERELHPMQVPGADDHFVLDEDGWPVLKRKPDDGVVVTNDLVNKLREEEGI